MDNWTGIKEDDAGIKDGALRTHFYAVLGGGYLQLVLNLRQNLGGCVCRLVLIFKFNF